MALAGGASIAVPQAVGYLYQEGGIRSPDGHCRAFDALAQGTVGGNGVGIVVLKRLEDALADGDPIRAVILGSAVNNDGSGKVGYTAPGVNGQAAVIQAALEASGVDPRTVGYVEAHGTGTPLGDPIEVAALTQAFREAGALEQGFCALGSVKTNIGHLDTAAGVVGLIKATLALERGVLPPSLHFESPNPAIDFAASPFRVNDRLREWRPDGTPRRAGVSSFGIGGTNAHAVLEEPPAGEPGSLPRRPWQLLVVSARTPSALDAAAADLHGFLTERPETDLADVAWTLQTGRRAFRHRRAVLCKDAAGAVAALAAPGGERAEEGRSVVFLFPGQGTQHPGMGLGLMRSEPVFREEIDRAAEILHPWLGVDLRDLLSGDLPVDWEDTAIAQPALFAVEHALASVWESWGIRPEAMIGHSLGEYVAACRAGVFSFEDGLALLAERGRLLGGLPRGSMASLPLSEDEVSPLLTGRLALAAVNSPSQCVISGPEEEVRSLIERLAAGGIEGRRLRTSHAFHSSLVEPVMAAFASAVRRVPLSPPRIPWISNVTGTWISAAEATDPGYWAHHLRATVRFADGLTSLLHRAQDQSAPVLLEVGPGRTLSALVRRHPDRTAAHPVVTSLPHPDDERDEVETVLSALGQLWCAGAPVDWRAFHAGERRRRISLPTYPFERRRYWIEPGKALSSPMPPPPAPERRELADWFWVPFWKPAPPVPAGSDARGPWLIFLGDAEEDGDIGLGEALLDHLQRLGAEMTVVRPGGRSWRREDYDALLSGIARERGSVPPRILHLRSARPPEPADDFPERLARLEKEKERGFYDLLFLLQALGDRGGSESFQVTVVTACAQRVAPGDLPCPERAMMHALCRVAPHEQAGLSCRVLDLGFPLLERWLGRIAADLAAAPTSEPLISWRGGERWQPDLAPIRLEPGPSLRDEEVWLVTGGLGGLGLEIAEHLAASRARLVLLGRSSLPPEPEWGRWLDRNDGARESLGASSSTADRIARVRRMQALGAEVVVEAVDAADAEALQAAARRAVERFGRLDGVIHAAGVPGGGLLGLRTRESLEEELAAKVQGTLAVGEICREHSPRHLVLFSSTNALSGQLGQAGYCAANAFLDAWAHLHAAETGTQTLTINWDRWQGTGMAAAVERRHRELTGTELTGGISPAEGAEAFLRVLASGRTQMVVSPGDLAVRLARERKTAVNVREALERRPTVASVHDRPSLSTAYVPPSDELEQEIADIWQEVFGIHRIGIHDDFFELGGDSLVALQLVSRLGKATGIEIRVRSLFDARTIAALAVSVEDAMLASSSEEELDLVRNQGELP
jgi:malonyl CoA-acyl carrier protein transacylase/acyl carrier protein